LAIPAITGAALMAWMELPADAQEAQLPDLGLGAAIAGVSAYACIRLFIALIERIGLMPYVYYRLALGAALFVMLYWRSS
ncbi:MAG: undecaprenyl-diphosphatase, partial [Gammaproteobacteria bacterium]|nr:undecaprenyl-diphosphatase [Gammaproteobacteria bacterium]